MIRISVNRTDAQCEHRGERLTAGRVGLTARFDFSADWAGLGRTAVAEGSGRVMDVPVGADGCVVVPHECLAQAGSRLRIGVYGASGDGTVVIPTVYASVGLIEEGANPSGDTSADPALPVWGEILGLIGDLSALETADKRSLVSAINEAAGAAGQDGRDGGYYIPAVDEEGNLAWTASRADMDGVAPANIRGPRGLSYAGPPAFANTVEDCADTSQVYVLPDGYLYAYMRYTGPLYQNLLPAAKDPDTLASGYNGGTGYLSGFRLNSSGVNTDASGWAVTGLIPCAVGDTVRTRDIAISASTNSYITFYDGTGAMIKCANGQNIMNNGYLDIAVDGLEMTFTVTASYAGTSLAGTAYFRLSVPTGSIGASPAVIVNQTFAQGSGYMWANTGHVYQPADYEDRIAALEGGAEELDGLSQRLEALELAGGEAVPDYVRAEAADTAARALEKITPGSLVMALGGDAHLPYNSETYAAVLHTGMAIGEIQKTLRLDMAAFLGDFVKGGASSTKRESFEALRTCREYLNGPLAGGVPVFWLEGNHDDNPYGYDGLLDGDERYRRLGRNSEGLTADPDNLRRCCGYRDFPGQRVRVVCLNTCDTGDFSYPSAGGLHRLSPAQLQWLAGTALNLDDKPDKALWGLVILSHTPLNWESGSVTAEGVTYALRPQYALEILDAFTGRAAGSLSVEGQTVAYDFTGAAAEVIAAFHGHTHNFRVSRIGSHDLPSIAVPQICFGRYNEYTGADFGEFDGDGNSVYYYKTAGTAQDTSFNLCVIDRENRLISCVNYGAGIDRTVAY